MKIVQFDDTPRTIQMVAYYTGLVTVVALVAHAVLQHGYGVGIYLDWGADSRRSRVVSIAKGCNESLTDENKKTSALYVVQGKEDASLGEYAVFSSTKPTDPDAVYYTLLK